MSVQKTLPEPDVFVLGVGFCFAVFGAGLRT